MLYVSHDKKIKIALGKDKQGIEYEDPKDAVEFLITNK